MTLSTERPSLRSRLHRVLVRIAVGMLVLVCLTYVCKYVTEWHRRERLEALVQSIKTPQVGVTSDDDVRTLSERFGERFSPEGTFTEPRTSTFDLNSSSPYVFVGHEFHTLPGCRLWMVDVSLMIRERRLVGMYVRFILTRSDGYFLSPAVYVAKPYPLSRLDGASYFVSEPHVTGPPSEALKVFLSPEATTAEKDKGFRINFSCLTALRECRHPCDVLPEAWRDLRVLHPGEREDSMDADCRQAGR